MPSETNDEYHALSPSDAEGSTQDVVPRQSGSEHVALTPYLSHSWYYAENRSKDVDERIKAELALKNFGSDAISIQLSIARASMEARAGGVLTFLASLIRVISEALDLCTYSLGILWILHFARVGEGALSPPSHLR